MRTILQAILFLKKTFWVYVRDPNTLILTPQNFSTYSRMEMPETIGTWTVLLMALSLRARRVPDPSRCTIRIY